MTKNNYSPYIDFNEGLTNNDELELNKAYEAFLVYNGAPAIEDDPADYYVPLKGVRIA